MKKGSNYTKEIKDKIEEFYNTVATKYDNVLEQAKEIVTDHQIK
jgi:hypothetical protein